MGSLKTQSFSPRIARFLNPLAKTINEAAAPIFKPTKKHSKPHFKGWDLPPNKWAEWVDQMAGKHSSIWIKSGIFDSVMSSIYEIPFNHDIILALLEFWTPKTNTFVFPWGEATITLEDVMILGGYSVLGDSVDSVSLMAGSSKLVEEMDSFRLELIRSKSKRATHSKWIQMFMTKQDEQGQEHKHEHIAFLSLWLSRFVFPPLDRDSIGKHVFPIAVKLSQGDKLNLASVILASIYDNLTTLKELNLDSSYCFFNLLGPFLLVQIWVYERLPTLAPKTPNELCPGEPRLARWHGLNLNVSLPLLHSHMIKYENFIWRPYAVHLKNWMQPRYYQDIDQIITDFLNLDDNLLSFIQFIQPCKLIGLSCKAKYLPHRVGMQFGFDQDIPANISSYKHWKFVKFLIPSRSFQPQVSMRYSDWWKNVDPKDYRNDQDVSLGERMNESMEAYEEEDCDLQCVHSEKNDLGDGIDDIFMSLKNISNATKRKIDSLKGSYVGDPQCKKKRLEGKSWNDINDPKDKELKDPKCQLADSKEKNKDVEELRQQLGESKAEIEEIVSLKKQLADAQDREAAWLKETNKIIFDLNILKDQMSIPFKDTADATENPRMLLAKAIAGIYENLKRSCELLIPVAKVVKLAILLGHQQHSVENDSGCRL